MLSYTQRFVDSDNQRATYRGSIYAVTRSLSIIACKVEIKADVVDHFTGQIAKIETGEQQDNTVYTVSFDLTRDIADALRVIEAAPIQLRATTHAVCEKNDACSLHWIRINAKTPAIKTTIMTNGFLEFRGNVREAMIPIANASSSGQIIERLQAFSQARCQ